MTGKTLVDITANTAIKLFFLFAIVLKVYHKMYGVSIPLFLEFTQHNIVGNGFKPFRLGNLLGVSGTVWNRSLQNRIIYALICHPERSEES